MSTAPRTFTFDKAFPLIARSIERSYEISRTFVSRREIMRELLADSNGRKLVDAARRRRKREASLQRTAGNMIDWFSQRWTMQDEKWESLFELFERRKDGRLWSYKPVTGARGPDIILEGAIVQRSINIYDRSSLARLKCIAVYGTSCHVCGFSFGAKYGKAFDRVILVHHLRPLGEIREKHIVDPIKDLRPVCANCHIVLHTRTPAYSINELQSLLHRAGKGKHAKAK